MRKSQTMLAAAVVGIAGAAIGAFALQTESAPADSPAAAFRVTAWPPAQPGREYGDEVETYLNRMAADGWLFKTEIVGQREKLMLFERRR